MTNNKNMGGQYDRSSEQDHNRSSQMTNYDQRSRQDGKSRQPESQERQGQKEDPQKGEKDQGAIYRGRDF